MRSLHQGDLLYDLRLSLRALSRAPVLAITIVLTVGIGIGATTAMFSAVEAAFLRPLPYADPDRLIWIYTDDAPFQFRFSAVDILALDAQRTQLQSVAGFTNRTLTYADGAAAEVLRGRAVTWQYFNTLGLRMQVGRDFNENDGRPGSPSTVILSHPFWRDRLGARSDIVGTTIRLDGADHTVVGVLPETVGPLEARQDVFVAAQISPPKRKGPFLYWMVGRLKDGVSREAAAAELHAINKRLFPLWRASYQSEKATWGLLDLKERLVGQARTTALLALGAVALVWLLACLNASNLLVARVSSRGRELAIRAALGASRRRVLQVLLIEAGLLAACSAVVAFGIASAGMALLRTTGATYLPRTNEIGLSTPVVAVFAATVVISTFLFGLIPAVQGVGSSLARPWKEGARGVVGSRRTSRFRRVLVGLQFAISTPLLVLALLLFGTLNELKQVDLGIDSEHVVTASLRLPAAAYRDDARVNAYWDEAGRRLRAVPGVSGAAFADGLPPDSGGNINNFDLEDARATDGRPQSATPWLSVSPEYFAVLGITLLEGRLLDERDSRADNQQVIVVDRAWAKRFFPSGSAVGRRLREGGCTECPWTTVVGVVSDVRYVGLDGTNQGTVYAPILGNQSRYIVVRAQSDPRAIVPSVRTALRELDPEVPLTEVATVADLVGQAVETPATLARLLGTFAAAAGLLAFVGIFGVMSNYVQQNRQEISIRMAIGGSPGRITRLVASQALTMIATGVFVGLPLAYAAASFISSLLFGVSPAQPSAYVVVVASLLTLGLTACAVPLRRALQLEPASLLRQ